MVRLCWSAILVAARTTCIPRTSLASSARTIAVLLVLSTSSACRRSADNAAATDTAANAVPGANTVPTVGVPGDTAAPQGATWNLELAEGQLREAGFTVNRDRTPINVPFMSVPGTALDLGNGTTVQVYLYGDAAARGLDTDKLDATRAAPRNGAAPWRTPATLVTDNNLAAIVLTSDQTARARITEALHRRSEGDGSLR
jgi:hypothetical protein